MSWATTGWRAMPLNFPNPILILLLQFDTAAMGLTDVNTSTVLFNQILEDRSLVGESAAFTCLITMLSSCLPTSLMSAVYTCCSLVSIFATFLLAEKVLPPQWRNKNCFCELDHSLQYFSGSISYHLPKCSTWLRNSKYVSKREKTNIDE